jgi:hypothetical protein
MNNSKNNISELSKIKKETPFGVPENYFDDFAARLQMKLDAEKTVVSLPKNQFIKYIKPVLGMAASFALIFMLVYWPIKTFTPKQVADTNSMNNETNVSDLEYRNMVEGIDESSFLALLEEPVSSVNFSDEEIVSYLQTNSSDYEIYAETH